MSQLDMCMCMGSHTQIWVSTWVLIIIKNKIKSTRANILGG